MSVDAANPAINATVTASAGSGKTWMLVTRILRLLLDGAPPGGILALTFTRKAAAEMQQRLAERLYQLATAEPERLDRLLAEIGIDHDEHDRQRARELYEFHQYCDYPVRTQTFHSFCQDILGRFPLEADVPPDFDLLDSSSLLIRQAREALFNEAALNMQGPVAAQLQALMEACGGLFNLNQALDSFLYQRSDWWAFTENRADACGFAEERLQQQLDVDADEQPISDFFSAARIADITEFARLLAATEGKTNLQHADQLALILAESSFDDVAFERLARCFLTQKNTAIVSGRKDSKSLRNKLKSDAERFLQLAQQLPEHILATRDRIHRLHTLQLNRLWYHCGEHLVAHYQKLKRELRLLDFTDLEWNTYRLLQQSDNALWVQYKLDQRIDHLLIDEFQDTNPTQWQLLRPLLEEMVNSDARRARSVFLVGDEKQSIYSFRRAKPELQARASQWLHEHLDAQPFPLNKSWRSSPAIMAVVNKLFAQPEYQSLLPGFSPHETHLQTLPGRVQVFAAFEHRDETDENQDEAEPGNHGLRNPLLQPRTEKPSIYLQEGRLIADTIRQLITDNTAVGDADQVRPMTYDDIYILVRKRSHLSDYEQALRQAGIPYLGANRGTLLDCIEIQDMEALLDTLLTPFNNLALAQVLKSPLFEANDAHLMQLAACKETPLWIDRIALLSERLDTDHPLRRAHESIRRWREWVDRIPVHDLLDRIYHESQLLQRYHAATPDSLRPRVQANLTRFLELALELDSGRYPSLMHFLQTIRSLKTLTSDAPDEAPMETRQPRVKIMTIHASKGLEAPVIFLADTISVIRDRSAISTLVDWPADHPRPEVFQLIPAGDQRDGYSRSLLEKQRDTQHREQANLLYVAATRARQFLFVSACRPQQQGSCLDWHTPMLNALRELVGDPEAQQASYEYGDISTCTSTRVSSQQTVAPPPAEWLQTSMSTPRVPTLIAPSRQTHAPQNDDTDEDGQTRGLAIHRCLELLCNGHDAQQIANRLSEELQLAPDDPLIETCLQEARDNMNHADLDFIFHPGADWRVYNECPLHYALGDDGVFGLVDRLLVSDDRIIVIDYKSHIQANTQTIALLAQTYRQQMRLYTEGAQRVWPHRKVEAYLLFTHCRCLQPMPVQ